MTKERVQNSRNLRKAADRIERKQRERKHDGRTLKDRGEGLAPATLLEQDPKLLAQYPKLRGFNAVRRPKVKQPMPERIVDA